MTRESLGVTQARQKSFVAQSANSIPYAIAKADKKVLSLRLGNSQPRPLLELLGNHGNLFKRGDPILCSNARTIVGHAFPKELAKSLQQSLPMPNEISVAPVGIEDSGAQNPPPDAV